jgi:hypothetical protein
MKVNICDEGPWFSIINLKVHFLILNYIDVLKIG